MSSHIYYIFVHAFTATQKDHIVSQNRNPLLIRIAFFGVHYDNEYQHQDNSLINSQQLSMFLIQIACLTVSARIIMESNSHPPTRHFPLVIAFCCLQNLIAPSSAVPRAKDKHRAANGIPSLTSCVDVPDFCFCRRNSWAETMPITENASDVLKYPRNVLSLAIRRSAIVNSPLSRSKNLPVGRET